MRLPPSGGAVFTEGSGSKVKYLAEATAEAARSGEVGARAPTSLGLAAYGPGNVVKLKMSVFPNVGGHATGIAGRVGAAAGSATSGSELRISGTSSSSAYCAFAE